MPRKQRPDRRNILRSGAGLAGALLLAGCTPLSEQQWVLNILGAAESVNLKVQRMLLGASRLAPEFSEADISTQFKSNGTGNPPDADYQSLAENNFADWRLEVAGLVENPLKLSLDDLRGMPSRTQITRHDCVEGWSCIGKWKGVPLSAVLARAVLKPQARYIVFRCADTMDDSGSLDAGGGPKYYESIDLVDALHPQTILAYDMNDKTLPVPYGAPLRVRIERQLGYKMAKYIMRIEAVERFSDIGDGKGGYWEDRGYDWYAGI